jgi:flagellar biosynthetic protein FliR
MLNFSSDQLYVLVASFILPLTRVLGFIATAPVFGNSAVPGRVKLLLGVALAVVVAPSMPPVTGVDPSSWMGLGLLLREFTIGVAMGFTARLVFAAVEMAGELVGTQIGLGFAMFYSPALGGATLPTSRLFAVLATLTFLSIDGHLLMIAAIVKSFYVLPINPDISATLNSLSVATLGSELFAIALSLALPVVGALLITNIALGILSRAAPQLNLFSLGFPVMLMIGLIVLTLGLPNLIAAFGRLPELVSNSMSAAITGH